MSDRSGLGHRDWSGLGWQSLCPADLIQQSRSLGVRQTQAKQGNAKQHKPKQRTSTACKAKQDKAEANQINGWPNQTMTPRSTGVTCYSAA